MKDMLLLTIFGVMIYIVSDMILTRLEVRRGARFPKRSIVFFIIFLVLAAVVFQVMEYYF